MLGVGVMLGALAVLVRVVMGLVVLVLVVAVVEM